jgi:hypothetical protein
LAFAIDAIEFQKIIYICHSSLLIELVLLQSYPEHGAEVPRVWCFRTA